MKSLYVFAAAAVLFLIGCATTTDIRESPVKESEVVTSERKEPVEVVTTVFDPVKETSLYADGTVDEVTLYTYDERGERLLKKELFDSANVLQEWEEYEYSGSLVSVKRRFDKSNELQGYHRFQYDTDGLLISDEIFNAKDELQSKSEYIWKNGSKVKWNVYDGTGTLLSTTEYIYENGLNTRIQNLNPGGDVEEYFILKYNSDGLLEKTTHFNKDDKVLDARVYEYKGDFLVMEKVLRGNGSVKRKIVYSNDTDGNPVEIIFMDAGDNVQERIMKEYKSREVISYVTE